ncbi:BAP31 domain protein [Aspergillus luchuensis]|uniref:BAP31 domain protein n=1 Tax=Aspergillus kawachii TaxID=1069201 RepID=A0A146F8G8_ASPKA|nr:BAP31 domain protein [Aspergillus luchuensis]
MSAKMGGNHGQGAKKKSPDARVELAAFGSHEDLVRSPHQSSSVGEDEIEEELYMWYVCQAAGHSPGTIEH